MPLQNAPSGDSSGVGGAPLVVIGDALLDQDMTGVVRRISPEAPVPVVDQLEASYRPGGAGLAAALGTRHSRPVVLVTALAGDDRGVTLTGLLSGCGIRVLDLGLAGSTPVKSRIRADQQSLLMLSEQPPVPGWIGRQLSQAECGIIAGAAAVLVSDYGGGVARQPSVRAVLSEVAAHVPVVWDIHPAGPAPVPGVRLVTPNAREAETLAASVTGQTLSADIDRARLLLAEWRSASVAVTRGSAGAVLVDGQDSLPLVVPARAIRGDSCGAGDCFAVTVAALLAESCLVSEAVTGAVEAAARFVAAGGPASVTAGVAAAGVPVPATVSLVSAAGSQVCPGTVGPGEGARMAAETRAAGGLVVATSGCFDILHAGHVAMLGQARTLGDCLIVCLNDDDSVRRLKGDDRPIVSAQDRASVLAALAVVDAVVIFGEDRPDRALREIRPDVYVKGGDYRIDEVLEAPLVASWGGQTVVLPYFERWSTTQMINKIAQRG